jgi:predicted metalloprotease with PDZ domain
MTEATKILQPETDRATAKMLYRVAMPEPTSHLFEVTLRLNNWQLDTLDLKMPVWTPGSYLIREYARNVWDFAAFGEDDRPLASQKISKNHWQIKTENRSQIQVKYRVFANELSVRTNHLDSSHGYFNGAAMFFYIPGWQQHPIQLEIVPPSSDWKIATTLPLVTDRTNIFEAKDFDTLVDSPVEIGKHQLYDFEAVDKPHQLAVWGTGNLIPETVIQDTIKIIETEAKLFDGLPYEKYLFLLHLSASGYGGLEHKDSCTLNYPRFGFRDREKYQRFIQLVAHEFFHLWNVKRIRPKTLESFDYDAENYTTSLWFCEGTTSYYDILIPLRAGIYNRKSFLENLSKDITRYLTIPGRKIQSLAESSFDAWIKLYRRDADSDNHQISYYLKGELVSLLLDLFIRAKFNNRRSLDNVMVLMWQRFGIEEIGFTPEQLQDTISEVADCSLESFFDRYLKTTQELPFNDYLEPFGLYLNAIEEESIPYTGMKVQLENEREIIKFVELDSPSAQAGINAGDELLAIDGIRVSSQLLNERLKDYQVGDVIHISVFHQDELKTLPVILDKSPPNRYEILRQERLSDLQQQNLSGWLGAKW